MAKQSSYVHHEIAVPLLRQLGDARYRQTPVIVERQTRYVPDHPVAHWVYRLFSRWGWMREENILSAQDVEMIYVHGRNDAYRIVQDRFLRKSKPPTWCTLHVCAVGTGICQCIYNNVKHHKDSKKQINEAPRGATGTS